MVMLSFDKRKIFRTEMIADYVNVSGLSNIVIFSCGNASEALKKRLQYCDIVDIAPNGRLAPTNHWWSPEEIRRSFPNHFDATSGHLPIPMMVRMAKVLRDTMSVFGLSNFKWLPFKPEPNETYRVPTGSGETILILRWAFPESIFVPVYNISEGTKYNAEAPLNFIVSGGCNGKAENTTT